MVFLFVFFFFQVNVLRYTQYNVSSNFRSMGCKFQDAQMLAGLSSLLLSLSFFLSISSFPMSLLLFPQDRLAHGMCVEHVFQKFTKIKRREETGHSRTPYAPSFFCSLLPLLIFNAWRNIQHILDVRANCCHSVINPFFLVVFSCGVHFSLQVRSQGHSEGRFAPGVQRGGLAWIGCLCPEFSCHHCLYTSHRHCLSYLDLRCPRFYVV